MVSSHVENQYTFAGKINHRIVKLFYVEGALPNHTYKIDHTLRFLSENFERGDSFTNMLLGSVMDPNKVKKSVYDTANKLHLEDRRKATHDPYMKHVLYTTYISHEIGLGKEYDDYRNFILLSGSLFHDSIEMKRKRKKNYSVKEMDQELQQIKNLNANTRRKLMIIASMSTPPVKDKGLPLKKWIEVKRKDWRRLASASVQDVIKENISMNQKLGRNVRLSNKEAAELAEMIVDIKFADTIANIVETWDDISHQRDGLGAHNDLKSLNARVAVFNERAVEISERYHGETFEIKMHECLQKLNDFIRDREFEAIV